MNHPIYLDNSATTPVRPEVMEAMLPYLSDRWGNPSSIHSAGRQAAEALKLARAQVAGLLNCLPEEIYFTPCGTYSNNCAIIGRARFSEANGLGRHMITTRIEHPAVLGPAGYLEAQGWRVTYLEASNEGLVSPEDLKQSICSETSIISIMWANNEIGSVQPIKELSAIAEESGVYFHTDAVQIPGKLPLDVSKSGVSSLSLSGHKFYAPKGTGVLFVRTGVNMMPLVFGGGQERGLFPGTEAMPAIAGIGKAAELAREELDFNFSLLRKIQQHLMVRLQSVEDVEITGPKQIDSRLPGHVSLVVPGGDGEAMVMQADLRGICISSGSACHQGIKSPSGVLTAIGIPDDKALGSVRVSAGRFSTPEECAKAADVLADIFARSRPVKPGR